MLARLRSVLSTTRRLVTLAVVAVLLLAGVAIFFLSQPSVAGVDNRFGNVNETTTVIESELRVRNPNPIGASLGGLTVDYAIDLNGIRMATGIKKGVSVDQGESTVPMTTALANERIPTWWVSHIRNGERTTLAVNADVHSATLGTSFGAPKVTREIETDIISAFNSTASRPVGSSPTGGPILVIRETSAQWGAVSAAETNIDMRFVVHNPNSYAVPVSELSYRTTMNGVEMGNGTTDGQGVIPPGGTRTIEATTTLNNQRIDEWWVSHLQRDQVTDLRIDFSVTTEISGTSIQIPMDRFTYAETIETDIFGTKDATDAAGGNGTDESEPEDGTTGSSDGTTTADGSGGTATDGGSGDDGTTSGGGTTTDGDGILGVRATDVARIA